MSKTYKYEDPEGEHIYTEEQILKEYFPYWKDRMEKAGKADYISEQNCIDDWVITNWAYEYKEER